MKAGYPDGFERILITSTSKSLVGAGGSVVGSIGPAWSRQSRAKTLEQAMAAAEVLIQVPNPPTIATPLDRIPLGENSRSDSGRFT